MILRITKFYIILFLFVLYVSCTSTPSGGETSSSTSSTFSAVTAVNLTGADLANTFYLAKGAALEGNGTITNIDGSDCLLISALSVADSGNYAVEAQWDLAQPTDMSSANFIMDFDVYIPSVSIEFKQGLQFAFYDVDAGYIPIYSGWWVGSVVSDQWKNFKALVAPKVSSDPLEGFIDYSGFANNPDDWTNLTKVRIQYVVNAQTNITFYVRSIVITNRP